MGSEAINYFHIFFVAPLLGYVGYSNYIGQPVSQNFAIFVIILAVFVILYHAYRVYTKTGDNKDKSPEQYQRRPLERRLAI